MTPKLLGLAHYGALLLKACIGESPAKIYLGKPSEKELRILYSAELLPARNLHQMWVEYRWTPFS